MTQLPSTVSDRTSVTPRPRDPAVLAILVVRNGMPWLRDCLRALGRQTHPRLGVVAVDIGSADGSRELLERALGADRVLERHERYWLVEKIGDAADVAEESDPRAEPEVS